MIKDTKEIIVFLTNIWDEMQPHLPYIDRHHHNFTTDGLIKLGSTFEKVFWWDLLSPHIHRSLNIEFLLLDFLQSAYKINFNN